MKQVWGEVKKQQKREYGTQNILIGNRMAYQKEPHVICLGDV